MVENFFKIFKWEEIHKEYISERVVIKDVCLVSYGVKTGWKVKNSWINYSIAIKKMGYYNTVERTKSCYTKEQD